VTRPSVQGEGEDAGMNALPMHEGRFRRALQPAFQDPKRLEAGF
jgi:hypothetical protein